MKDGRRRIKEGMEKLGEEERNRMKRRKGNERREGRDETHVRLE